MIKKIKTTKAYIRCAESEATSNNLCPHLQPNKTKGLSMPCMPSIYAVHGSNKPRFYASDEKPEMMLKRERNHYDRRIKND
jgi:hypothetical protein